MNRVLDGHSVSGSRTALLVVALGLLVAPLGWSQTVAQSVLDSATVEVELRAFEAAHGAAVDSKDIEGILQFYAVDLITVTPGQPILRGRDWIRSSVAELFRTYDFHETFTLSDIRIFGDRVAATLQYSQHMTPLTGGKPIAETGKGMCILKRSEPRRWQFEWNAYAPDVKPAAAKD